MGKINKLIKSLLNKKVLGLNSILNKNFKIKILVFIKDLVKVASYYFTSRIILKCLKKSIIIVLRKEGKITLLSSYKLIIFKNILVKVLKIYVVNIIPKAAEDYKLFL